MAAGEQWKQDGDAIVRDLEFDDFKAAMAVNRVADLAEETEPPPLIPRARLQPRPPQAHDPQRGPA